MSAELEMVFSPEMLRALDERIRRIALEAQPQSVPPEEFVSLKTASARFDIPVGTLKKWARSGRLRKYKIEGCVRIRPSDLLREEETDG